MKPLYPGLDTSGPSLRVEDILNAVRELDEKFGPLPPAAFRVHPSMLYELRRSIDRIDAETCPNPFAGITIHTDIKLLWGVVVPMTAAEERAWLHVREQNR